MERVRAVFVYANPRGALPRAVDQGLAPDTGLLGQNHLAELGIDATVHDPLLTRRVRSGPAHRAAWHLRELTVPLELPPADAVCTPLANLLPLTLKLRRLRAVVVNYGLNLIARRSSAGRRRLLRASLRSAASVVCLGESQHRELVEIAELQEAKVRTALFGIDERFFPAASLPQNGYVLSVGRDLARDYATLAVAVERLAARVIVVAEERNVSSIRLPANVEVRRGLSYPELRELYAGAACVVIPMRKDGYPYGSEASGLTAFLEASACARPVVSSERAIMRDYVESGRTGLLAPPEDPDALRAALEQVLGDRELAAELGRGARDAVEERFTTRHFAQRLAPLILEAARR